MICLVFGWCAWGCCCMVGFWLGLGQCYGICEVRVTAGLGLGLWVVVGVWVCMFRVVVNCMVMVRVMAHVGVWVMLALRPA